MAQTQLKSKLTAEGTIPSYLPKAVEDGKREFEKMSQKYHLSQVHTEEDTFSQALLLGITARNYDEARRASILMYGLHWLDDKFDNPQLSPSPEEMRLDRGNIQVFIQKHEELKKIAESLAENSVNVDGFYQGLERLRYGGLIQTSKDPQATNKYLKELKKFGLEGVAKDVQKDIAKLSDVAYWMTTKVDAELLESGYRRYNRTLEELWNVAYGPAIYLHDAEEEEKQGELNFNGQGKPKISEMANMIDIATKHVGKYESDPERRLLQVRFLQKSFRDMLPQEVSEAYERLGKELEKISHSKGQHHGLEGKFLTIIGISSLIFSTIFFSSNITGNVIVNISKSNSNVLGVILFIWGILFLFFSSKKRMIYYK